MSDLNVFTLVGRLTKDAVKKNFQSGKPFMTFDLANNTGYGDYASVQYFSCIVLDKRAESLAQYMTKGKQVAVSGTLEANNWTNTEGQNIKGYQLKIKELELLGGGEGGGNYKVSHQGYTEEDDPYKKMAEARYNSAGHNKIAPDPNEDSIPF